MPIRTFDALDIINVAPDAGNAIFASGIQLDNGSSITSGFGTFNFTVSGTGSGTSPSATTCGAGVGGVYQLNGDIDFNIFPKIPINALITKVEIGLDGDYNLQGTQDGIIQITVCGFLVLFIDHTPGGIAGSFSFAANKITSLGPYTYAAFVSAFGHVTARIAGSGTSSISGSPPLGPVSLAGGFDVNNFRMDVTYIESGFAWFVPFETVIVNGRPFRIPTGSAVLVADGVPPGDNYYNAGTDEPVESYWFSPYWYTFYPFTLIPPDDVSEWVPLDITPTCTNCLTLPLGGITVLVADASGIYQLITDKTNDTMYVRDDPAAVVTVDVMIPPPMAKTAFVP